MLGINDKFDLSKQSQCTRKLSVGEVVAHLAALARGSDKSASAQTRQVVRDVGAAFTQLVGEFSGIRRTVEQSQQDAATYTVGHRRPNPRQRVDVISHHCASHAAIIVQQMLYYILDCSFLGTVRFI